MAKKLLLCLLAVSVVILFVGCDNTDNGINDDLGGDNTGENLIILHPNGGVGSIESIPYETGEIIKIPYNEDEIVREGYDFIIWNTKADGSGKDYARKDHSEGDEKGTIILYAQWYKHYDSGDPGPQGGRVFYSRIEDGREDFSKYPEWIYLEVAPKELNYVGQWALSRDEIGGTKPDIGAGKANTELIIEKHSEECIAYMCKNNPLADESAGWYLPSRLELGYLYGNIYEHEDYPSFDLELDSLGTFFWSSTEGFLSGDQDPRGRAAVFTFQTGIGRNQINYHYKDSSNNARPVRQF